MVVIVEGVASVTLAWTASWEAIQTSRPEELSADLFPVRTKILRREALHTLVHSPKPLTEVPGYSGSTSKASPASSAIAAPKLATRLPTSSLRRIYCRLALPLRTRCEE